MSETTATLPSQATECPECAAAVPSKDVLVGEILDCRECGVELEVRAVGPVALQVAPAVEEDWGE